MLDKLRRIFRRKPPRDFRCLTALEGMSKEDFGKWLAAQEGVEWKEPELDVLPDHPRNRG